MLIYSLYSLYVLGPYFAMGGFLTFLFSKEIWVVDHYFFEVLGFWGAMYIIINKWGGKINEYATGVVDVCIIIVL